MKRTVFVLGATPKLAVRELQSLYPKIISITPQLVGVDGWINGPDAMRRLGGTVKIVQIDRDLDEISAEQLARQLAPLATQGQITFGVSIYGDTHKVAAHVLREIKNALTQVGIRSRFIEAQHGSALSSVVITKQHAIDLVIIALSRSFMVGHTIAVQDFEDWNTRDYGRPAVDPHAGMLPPKVARMIVNIASRGKPLDRNRVLMDPFCGTGTILCEALMMNWHVIGSDVSSIAVRNTEKNVLWLRAQYGLGETYTASMFQKDATHVSESIGPASVDAIVTEPFMGDPSMNAHINAASMQVVKNTLKGLEKLYIGCLRQWQRVLKPGGTVIMALPLYVVGARTVTVKNVVDRCESLGYTLVDGPIEYSRPQAFVRREFYVFEKKE